VMDQRTWPAMMAGRAYAHRLGRQPSVPSPDDTPSALLYIERTPTYEAVILNMIAIFLLIGPHIPTDWFPSAVRTMPSRCKPAYTQCPGLAREKKMRTKLRNMGKNQCSA
jgi:hypothetical protein